MMNRTIVSCVALIALAGASAALSQPEPTGRPGRQPAAGPGQDPEAFAQRLLQRDTDGDGKLSREELPGQFAQRIFDEFDTDGDELLSKDELMAFAKAAAERRLARRAEQGERGERNARTSMDFHQAMETAERGLRGLKRARFDGSATRRELMGVQMIQLGIVSAKMNLANAPKTEAGQAKYPNDEDYRRAMRTHLLEVLALSVELERAIMEGDAERARSLVEQIQRVEHDAHDLFQPEEDRDEKATDRPVRRRTGRPGSPAPAGGG